MQNSIYSVPYITHDHQISYPIKVSVPGSKSITNRALLLAALGSKTCTLKGALFSDDTRYFISCLKSLGFQIKTDETDRIIEIKGFNSLSPKSFSSIYVGSAGTAARFLSAYLAVCNGTYSLDASPQMRKRPMLDLLNALETIGCEINYSKEHGCFPFTLVGHGFQNQEICVNIEKSSQFLSALLMISCLSPNDFTIHTVGKHGMSYIHMTLKMMEQFHIHMEEKENGDFSFHAPQSPFAKNYLIEPDASAAAYFYACAPLLNVPVLVRDIHFDSLQGDLEFLHILEQIGCNTKDTKDGILLTPPQNQILRGVTVDMSTCSDQAITLSVLAPFLSTPTTITGIGHIRHQESNRIRAIITELHRLNISCVEHDDGITIYPGTPSPALVHTYDDHRMAMAFSLIGLKVKGIKIENPECCKKTFENYFETLESFLKEILYTKN